MIYAWFIKKYAKRSEKMTKEVVILVCISIGAFK
jgi:hypothetical protein